MIAKITFNKDLIKNVIVYRFTNKIEIHEKDFWIAKNMLSFKNKMNEMNTPFDIISKIYGQ